MGGKVDDAARLLGSPLMPWQRQVVDVAFEIDEFTGLPAYREVVILVPRQQGKTLMCLAVMVHRAMGFGPPHGPAQNILYTAQTGAAARTKFEKDHLPTLKNSPFNHRFKVRMANGHEAIMWQNGSWISLSSTTQSSGHGESIDLGFIDEAWAHQDERLEQAFKPAMMTRANAQLWIPSTAGKSDSYYLTGKMDNGRALVNADVRSGVAYFEWSASLNADPADPQTWRGCMPALGYTISENTIAADQKSMKPSEFRRAYLNIPENEVPEDWTVISEEDWSGLLDVTSQANDPVVFAMEVTHERTFGTISMAGARRDGLTHVEVVDHRVGTGWIIDRLVELQHKWRPAAIVVDPSGPAGSFIEPLETAGVRLIKPTMRDVATATGQFIDAVRQKRLQHIGGVPLTAAVAGAQRQPLGDAWRWARRGPSVDISPLVAVTLAFWAQTTHGRNVYDVLESVW